MTQQILIDKVLIPTMEVIARVISNPSIKVLPETDLWTVVSSLATAGTLVVLGIAELIRIYQWYNEHIRLNKKNRYKIDDSHCFLFVIHGDIDLRYYFTERLEIFASEPTAGAIYAFTIINQGTTHDYIYNAVLENGKGDGVDISVGHILKGREFMPEDLPHRIDSLQGEVWFVGVEKETFVDVYDPILVISTASGVYKLKMDKRMMMQSMPNK